MTPEANREAAAFLLDARKRGIAIEPLPARCRPATADEGYAVQAALHALLDERGAGAVGGYKIGCTSAVMQAFLDIGHPCAGRMRDVCIHRGTARFVIGDHVRPAVEAEIAVTLDHALEPAAAPFTRDAAASAVGTCHASIEIVDDRYQDFRTLGVPTLIADDFFQTGCVLGPACAGWCSLDLEALGCRLLVDGAVIASGSGADIMGHPMAALAWLANVMAARGETLAAGSVVTLGSMVQTHWVETPCTVTVEVEALGAANAVFG